MRAGFCTLAVISIKYEYISWLLLLPNITLKEVKSFKSNGDVKMCYSRSITDIGKHNDNLVLSDHFLKLFVTLKSRRMRWAGHVTRIREKRNAYRVLVGKPEDKRPLEDQNGSGWIILK
jgi:hypothetical protein